MSYVKKGIVIILTIAVAYLCFFGICRLRSPSEVAEETSNTYESFQGNIYDEERLEPLDMYTLTQAAKDASGVGRWRLEFDRLGVGLRYYLGQEYVTGWQYLRRNGAWDWFYLDEDTGYMVKNTILDGAVLSKQGYAIAVSAYSEETIQAANETKHCEEVLLCGSIPVRETIVLSKDMRMTHREEQEAEVVSEAEMECIFRTCDQSIVTISEEVTLRTNGNAQNGIWAEDESNLYFYGTIANQMGMDTKVQRQEKDENLLRCGIYASGENTQIVLGEGAAISGMEVGIYSCGRTFVGKPIDAKEELVLPFPRVVLAGEITGSTSIYGNVEHGVVQDGGTLTMTAGSVYNNGTLGGPDVAGSYGGGVLLTGGAVMHMSGGSIGGNKAVYGGGIYVDTGCTLNITGGTVGGQSAYDMSGNNTEHNGNYVRENQLAENGYRYVGGGGGGICSKGTLHIQAARDTNIAHNRLEGSVGGAGILLISGVAHFSGETIIVHDNLAYSSQAASNDEIVGNEDIDAEGGGIRIGVEESGSVVNCVMNCENVVDYPEVTGKITIRDNTAAGDGGGIFVSSNSSNQFIAKGSVNVENNLSQSNGGGGIKSNGGGLFLYNTSVYKNIAKAGNGGGILGAGIVNLEGCTMYQNHADLKGGAVALYCSLQGNAADGYIHECTIYDNTALLNGAAVEVDAGALGRIQGNTRVYTNPSSAALHCSENGNLQLGNSFIYSNGAQGIVNEGITEVTATVRVGFSSFTSTGEYVAAANAGGGVYNEGTLLVTGSKNFLVYGGADYALSNIKGTVSFANGTGSKFYGKNAQQIVYNQGTIMASGKGFLGSPLVIIAGDDVTYGLHNDGGDVTWRGNVLGYYTLTDTGMSKTDAGGITHGIYNQNEGVVRMQTGTIASNTMGIVNDTDSHLYMTGGSCEDSTEYGVYCKTGGQFHMGASAVVDSGNAVFLEKGCYIDIYEPLTASGTIAVLDTQENGDRVPGRIMAKVSYAGGDGASELYDDSQNQRFLLAYDAVDSGRIALLLDGSQIQGISEKQAEAISEQDIYLTTDKVDREVIFSAWLYDHTAWLSNQMAGSKTDEQYKNFAAGDTGVITFSSKNIVTVKILWPATGAADELKTYDTSGVQVQDCTYQIMELTESLLSVYENGAYRFTVPIGTPKGVYMVTLIGIDEAGEEHTCMLQVPVGSKRISGTFRTRIR